MYRRAFGDVESRGADGGNIVPGADGELYSTHSVISGYRWTYVVGVSLATSFELLPSHVGLPTPSARAPRYVAFPHDILGTGTEAAPDVIPFDDEHPLTLAAGPVTRLDSHPCCCRRAALRCCLRLSTPRD